MKQLLAALVLVWASAAVAGAGLPADVRAAIRKEYASPDTETRYVDGAVDLDADGKPEILVHVVGPIACGTGGCPTLVFTPEGAGYRLVTDISLTNPPIRASQVRTSGWRNLVVHVGGGGAKPGDVELSFDGKTYPDNPTVAGAHVKPSAAGGAQVVIEEFASFEATKPLDGDGAASAARSPNAQASASGPAFDCAKASSTVEKLICRNGDLSALDRTLAATYTKVMADARTEWTPSDTEKEHAAQRAWLAHRDACAKQKDVEGCVETRYKERLVELQIRGGDLTAPKAVEYSCKGHENEPFAVVFYDGTDPRSAVITMGDRQTIAFATPSGSGARYANPDVDLWEHHGEAAVTWSGTKYTCIAQD